MRGMTTMNIARAWAASLKENRMVNHWATTNYEHPFLLRIGADMRRPPEADEAPFIAIFPDGYQTGPQQTKKTNELGLIVAVLDDKFCEVNGVEEMRGLARLGEFGPILEKALSESLPKARVQEIAVEYELLQFPLVMALLSVTVEESLPI